MTRHVDDPTDLRHVGPATAAVLADAPFDAEDVATRRVSYAALVAAGANPGVAARIRREYSLPWALDRTRGETLRRRSGQVRTLSDGEREWVADSTDGWTEVEATDGGTGTVAGERAWRESE